MIIEIALGIVLAVLILRFLPLILALGVVALVAAVVLVVLVVAVWAIVTHPREAATLTTVVVVVGALMVGGSVASNYLNKRFGAKLVSAFFSASVTVAIAISAGVVAAIDLINHGVRRDGELAPLYWFLYGIFALALAAAIYYARAYWKILRTPPQSLEPVSRQ